MMGNKFWKPLLAVEFLGAAMFAVVSASYILGLPTDEVFHGELAYRIAISIFGVAFFAGSAVILVAALNRKSN